MTAVIAVVGRPNVGKSTLFNRLTRTRNALVADRPGVTRDRQYGLAKFEDRPYMLIDTGGLGDSEGVGDSFYDFVSQQSLHAIQEANAVIWLVDGRSGLTATDELLAEQLRPLCPDLHLVVNKMDGLDPHVITADFHTLGFGEPTAISAERGDGINALMERILGAISEEEDSEEEIADGLRISIIGRPNVGKSTLVNRMLGEERMLTFDEPGTTRDSVAIPFKRRDKDYVLIDTAGVRRRARVKDAVEKFSIVKSLQAIEKAEVVIMVIDGQEAVTEQDLSLLGLTAESGKSLIIAINKWDGLDDYQKTQIKNQIDRKLAFVDYAHVHFISALHGTGVGKLFDAIEKIRKSQNKEFKSSKVTELLENAVTAHPPPLVHGRRIKLRYAHIGGHNPLRIIVHGNQTEHVPTSYRRYLSNTLRKNLKLTGTPVLIEFKYSDSNPYKDKKNVLTKRQVEKKRRLMKHVKGKK